ncbi:hypothetical protein [Streptomyces sp. RLA2-12]|uniref:hypothetical protein n=1 Tax=Streptomyces sp. RLA2-12 TaxID=2721242 RepID=UPI00145C3C8B|nr:hypothetical protein [Streptomyces sp. RLA2-12]NMI63129.1 hypothetical protein [Streptomyces sp. RLA2-12]
MFDFLAKSVRWPATGPPWLVGPRVTTVSMTDALERDARTLLEEYDGGVPEYGERLAEGLARAQWSGSAFRAWLRDVPESVRAGRLIDVLDPAAVVLESADISGVRPALHGFLRHDMDRSGGSSS